MSNIFNLDFQNFIKALNNNDVDYILLGGYAVILYGYSRTTGDMDIFVRKDKENYQKIVAAFKTFGMPVFDMTEQGERKVVFIMRNILIFKFLRKPTRRTFLKCQARYIYILI